MPLVQPGIVQINNELNLVMFHERFRRLFYIFAGVVLQLFLQQTAESAEWEGWVQCEVSHGWRRQSSHSWRRAA